MRWGEIGNESIARRSADTLAHPIDEPGGHQPAHGCRKRKNELRESCDTVAKRGQPFALSEPIADCPGKNFGDHRCRLSDAFDEPDCQVRSAEHGYEIYRQQ